MATQPHLLIRADATPSIGIGHIMRCIALAQEWIRLSGRVTFLSCCTSDLLADRVTQTGAALVRLDPDAFDRHIRTTLNVLAEDEFTAVAADGYQFTPGDHASLGDSGTTLLVIDDYHHLPVYNADLVLNQNLGAEQMAYNTRADTRMLLGSRYTLLRDEFLSSARPAATAGPPDSPTRLLVSMGGSDPDNTTAKVAEALCRLDPESLSVRIILGPACAHLENVRQALELADFPWQIITDARDMPTQMAWADMAIAAAGSTAWELLYTGTPAVYLVNAENQQGVADALAAADAGINAGWHADIDADRLSTMIQNLVQTPELQTAMANTGKSLIDGAGRERVVRAILDNSGLPL